MIPLDRLNALAAGDYAGAKATPQESRDMARELIAARENIADLLETLAEQGEELRRLREAAADRGLVARVKRWLWERAST